MQYNNQMRHIVNVVKILILIIKQQLKYNFIRFIQQLLFRIKDYKIRKNGDFIYLKMLNFLIMDHQDLLTKRN